MEKEIITETKIDAVECEHYCMCQTESGTPYCKITGSINNTFLFTESRHPGGCSKQHAFGSAYICLCPVRQDIYMKTGV